ncbi:uncharacterized protein L3040_005257 [Drepanopeziza brunnea f. sp. 'multigermtubi']|nr:hypothetical protein L3040_005257 [Drepanopeziza brunnea f. sp. 'multigermtubi']
MALLLQFWGLMAFGLSLLWRFGADVLSTMSSLLQPVPYLLVAVSLLFLLFACHVSLRLFFWPFSRRSLPSSLNWAGADDGLFSNARANFRSLFHTRELVQEGYYKYSKNNLPFVLPNITTGPEVILPMSQMDWLLQQPDTVLSQTEVNRQFLQADWTMLHPKIIQDGIHADVIKREMTKFLGDFTEDVEEEIDYAFRTLWGTDTKNWVQVSAYHTMLDVIARVSNRVLVGLPLCRDEEYLDSSKSFARFVVVQAAAISQCPNFLRCIVAPLLNIFDTIRYSKSVKYHVPIIEHRKSGPSDDENKKNDYIQWSIDHSFRKNNPSERATDLISKRLSVLQFAAIHSSAITLTNLLIDLASSARISDYLSIIRNEVTAELAAENGVWSKAVLARMVATDSTIRETLRLWAFVSRGLLKEVVKQGGVTLPTGEHLPKGTKVGYHNYPIHHDADFYPDPMAFDPLRFCSRGEADEAADGKLPAEAAKKNIPLVRTSSAFMAFSHGKDACPGRFFASQQLKLVVAYIALNYDIEPLASRPDNLWLVGSQGPPMDVNVRIRRREGTV